MKSFTSVTCLALALASPLALATPAGELDPGFGNAGRRVVAFDDGGELVDSVGEVLVRPDQRVIVVGDATIAGGGLRSAIALTRLLPNGTVDVTFGSGGKAVHSEPAWTSLRGLAADLQADGKIVVAGTVRKTAFFNTDSYLCRFHPDGAIDTGFGDIATPGCRAYAPGGFYGVRVLQNGRIAAAGSERIDSQDRALVAVVDPDGEPTLGFGSQGRAIRNADAYFADVAEASDGTLVAVGVADDSTSQPKFMMGAIEADGQPDFGFVESGGVFTLGFGANRIFWGQSVVVAPDGSYVASGSAELVEGEGLRTAVARLLPDGSAAVGFAPFGFRFYDPCPAVCDMRGQDVKVAGDDSIVVAGNFSSDGSSERSDMYAMRLFSDGTPDPDYGNKNPARPGMSVVGFNLLGGLSYDTAQSLALQGDKVILAGAVRSTKSAGDNDFGIARLADGVGLFGDGFE
jgi:uncharacterized delta-60 repeat protein